MSRPRLPAVALSGALLALAAGGCVTRSLTIRSEPPGAEVYVNDRLLGESPMTFDFMWYGWHRVTLRKDGYARLDDRRHLGAPAHLWIPFDLVMEAMPFTVRDDRTWDYTLLKAEPLPMPMPPEPLPPAPEPTTAVPDTLPSAPEPAPAAETDRAGDHAIATEAHDDDR